MNKQDDIRKCHLTTSRIRTLRARNNAESPGFREERNISSTPPPPQFQSRRADENIARRLNLHQDFSSPRESRHLQCSAPHNQNQNNQTRPPPKCFSAGSTFYPNPSSYPFLPSTSLFTIPRSEEICGCSSGGSPLICVPRSAAPTTTSHRSNNSSNSEFLGKSSSASSNRCHFYHEGYSNVTSWNDNFSLSFRDHFKYAHGEIQTESEEPQEKLKPVQKKNKINEASAKCSDKINNTTVLPKQNGHVQKTQTKIKLLCDSSNQTEMQPRNFMPSPTQIDVPSSKSANMRRVDGCIDDDTFSDSETPLRPSIAFCSLKRGRDRERRNKKSIVKLPSLSLMIPKTNLSSASAKTIAPKQSKYSQLASCALTRENFRNSQETIALIPPPPEFASLEHSHELMPAFKPQSVENRKRWNLFITTSESSIAESEGSDSSSDSKSITESESTRPFATIPDVSLTEIKSQIFVKKSYVNLEEEPDYPPERFDYTLETGICEILTLEQLKREKITDDGTFYHAGQDYPIIAETGDSVYSNIVIRAIASASELLKSSSTILPKRSLSITCINGDHHDMHEYKEDKFNSIKPWKLEGEKEEIIKYSGLNGLLEGLFPQTYNVMPVNVQPTDCLPEIVIKKSKDGKEQRVTFYMGGQLEDGCDFKPTKSCINKSPKPIIVCPPSSSNLRGCRKPKKKCEGGDNRFAPVVTPLKPRAGKRQRDQSPRKKKPSEVFLICTPSNDQTGCNTCDQKLRSPATSECELANCGICIVLPPEQPCPQQTPALDCGTCSRQCSPTYSNNQQQPYQSMFSTAQQKCYQQITPSQSPCCQAHPPAQNPCCDQPSYPTCQQYTCPTPAYPQACTPPPPPRIYRPPPPQRREPSVVSSDSSSTPSSNPPSIIEPPPPPPPPILHLTPPRRSTPPPPPEERRPTPPVEKIPTPPPSIERRSTPPPIPPKISDPPSLRISDPPSLRISDPPPPRISDPPSPKISDPPPPRISEPSSPRVSEPIELPPPPEEPSLEFSVPDIFSPPELVQPPSLERLPSLPNMTREEPGIPDFSVTLPPFLPPVNLVGKVSSPILLIPPNLVQVEEPEIPEAPPVFEPKISILPPEPIEIDLPPPPPVLELEPPPSLVEPPIPPPPVFLAPAPEPAPPPVEVPPQPKIPPPRCKVSKCEPACTEEKKCDDNPCFNYDCCDRGCSTCPRGFTPPRPPRIRTTGTATKRSPFIVSNGGKCNRSNNAALRPRRKKDRCDDRIDQWDNNCCNSCSKRVNRKRNVCCEPRETSCCEQQQGGNGCNFPGNVPMFVAAMPPGGYVPPGMSYMPQGLPPAQPGLPQNPGGNICPPSYVPCPCPPEYNPGQWFPQQVATNFPPPNPQMPMQLPPEIMNQIVQFMNSSQDSRKSSGSGVPVLYDMPPGPGGQNKQASISNIPPEIMKQLAQFANNKTADKANDRALPGGMMGFFANPWANSGVQFGMFQPPNEDTRGPNKFSLNGSDYMKNVGGAPIAKNGMPFVIMPTTIPLNSCGQNTTCCQVNPCMTPGGPLYPCQGKSCKRRVTGGRKW